jgi:hypothetical protein
MGLGDTLEKLFSVEQEITIESAIMQFVQSGENFKSKTHLPFRKASLSVSLLEKLGEDMDDEFNEITAYVNKEANVPYKIKGKLNPDFEQPSKFINEILIEGMILEPSIDGKARAELLEAIKFRQEIKIKRENQDSLSQINEWLKR